MLKASTLRPGGEREIVKQELVTPMSQMGQTRTSADRFGMSVPPPIADIAGLHAQVRLVPKAEVANTNRAMKKPPEGGSQFKPDDHESGGH
jgi:hypothetical protein